MTVWAYIQSQCVATEKLIRTHWQSTLESLTVTNTVAFIYPSCVEIVYADPSSRFMVQKDVIVIRENFAMTGLNVQISGSW